MVRKISQTLWLKFESGGLNRHKTSLQGLAKGPTIDAQFIFSFNVVLLFYCSSSLVYIKLLVLWGLVLVADYFLEFRFEYLWPFWLFLRSVYDSFKYQGLAFSVFFICIAITSDMICFLFIPVHWLFFAASTYVWVQYVWHTGNYKYSSLISDK